MNQDILGRQIIDLAKEHKLKFGQQVSWKRGTRFGKLWTIVPAGVDPYVCFPKMREAHEIAAGAAHVHVDNRALTEDSNGKLWAIPLRLVSSV